MTVMIKRLTYYHQRIAGYSLATSAALLISVSSISTDKAASAAMNDCVTIEAPSTACSGKEFKMAARVTSGSTDKTPTYHWKVSAGIIVRGQGTTQLFVKGYTGKKIRAEV